MVSYVLYRGGGDCDRSGFSFKSNNLKITAKSSDYSHSGYDKGHLVNAEDFAYDCELEEITFNYYNCLPQTPELNRGIWKKNETEIREISQTDTLLIICGGFFSKKTIGDSLFVPDSCFKIVYSFEKKKIIMCYSFTNTNKPMKKELDFKKINLFLIRKHKIYLNKIIKK
jgi:DNA/RNA endonuclease G (NUC1)